MRQMADLNSKMYPHHLANQSPDVVGRDWPPICIFKNRNVMLDRSGIEYFL